MKRTIPAVSGAEVVNDLFSKTVKFEGREISAREAWLRGLYNESLAGNMDAAIELQRLRDVCLKEGAEAGCLLLPSPIPADEWERMCAEQQSPFRNSSYNIDGL